MVTEETESFKASTWQDWSSAIKEYEKLEALGYTKLVLWALQQEELYF
jgi:hypothetical protein